MTEEHLRETMRRHINLGQPADALRVYNNYLREWPKFTLDEASVTLAEQALAALAAPTPGSVLPTRRPIAPTVILSILCLFAVYCADNSKSVRQNRSASHTTSRPRQTKPDVSVILRRGNALFQACSYTQALTVDTEASGEAVRLNDVGASATALSYMGRDYEALGRLDEARNCYSCTLDIRRRIGPSISIAYEEEITGSLDVALGNYADARSELTDSLARRKSENDGAGVIECRRDLADLAIGEKNYGAAEDYLSVAASDAVKLRKPDMLAAIQGQQGKVASGLGDAKSAEKLLLSSLSYWRSKDHSRWIAVIESSLTEVKLNQGRTAEALDLAKDSLSRFQQVGDKYGEAKAELAEANVLKSTGREREAEPLLRQALEYAHSSSLKPLEKRVEAAMR